MGSTELESQGLQLIRVGTGPWIDAARLSKKDRKAIEAVFSEFSESYSVHLSFKDGFSLVGGESKRSVKVSSGEKRILQIFDRAQRKYGLGSIDSIEVSEEESQEANTHAEAMQEKCRAGLQERPPERVGDERPLSEVRYEKFVLTMDRISYVRNTTTAVAKYALRAFPLVARYLGKVLTFFAGVNGVGALVSGVKIAKGKITELFKQKDVEGRLLDVAMLIVGISLAVLGIAFTTWAVSTYISGAAAVGATALTALYISGFITFGAFALVGLYKLCTAASFRSEMHEVQEKYGTQGVLKWLKQQVTLSQIERELLGNSEEAIQKALDEKWSRFERRTNREALRAVLEIGDLESIDPEEALKIVGCVEEASFDAAATGALYIATGVFGTMAIVGSMMFATTIVGSLCFAGAAYLFTFADGQAEGKKYCERMRKLFGISRENARYVDLQIQKALCSSLTVREIAEVCMKVSGNKSEKALKRLAKVVEKEGEDIREIARRVSVCIDALYTPLELRYKSDSDSEKTLEHLRKVVRQNVNVQRLEDRMRGFKDSVFMPLPATLKSRVVA